MLIGKRMRKNLFAVSAAGEVITRLAAVVFVYEAMLTCSVLTRQLFGRRSLMGILGIFPLIKFW